MFGIYKKSNAGGADLNGIYTGSGTSPSAVVVTLTDTIEFAGGAILMSGDNIISTANATADDRFEILFDTSGGLGADGISISRSNSLGGRLTVNESIAVLGHSNVSRSLSLEIGTGDVFKFADNSGIPLLRLISDDTGDITSENLTAARIWTFPDATGTVSILNASDQIPEAQLLGGYGESDVFTMPLTGVTDNEVIFLGENRTVAANKVADYTIDFPLTNQHLCILVNTVSVGGDMVITGTSVDETSGVPTAADTETLTIDTTSSQYYQTTKKWLEVTNIDISSGTIDTIDYDILVIGYFDARNMDFKMTGYRLDAYAQSGANTSDFAFVITKVQDDGAGKMSFVILENIGVDSGGAGDQIIDRLRTAGADRTYNPVVANIWLDDTHLVFKQSDFDSFFSSGENDFESSTKNEGYILSVVGSPSGGISGVDFVVVSIDYALI